MPVFKDLVGEKNGSLVIIKKVPHNEIKYRGTFWVCKCECGKEIIVLGSNFKKTKSCGCKRKEFISLSNTIHGESKTRFYSIWGDIGTRTTNKKHKGYKNYGGRGIKNEWEGDFNKFKKDMHDSYVKHVNKWGEKDTTIERVNVNGDYCKEKCRWVRKIEQARNKRSSHFINFNEKKLTVAEWSKELGIPNTTIHNRIKRKLSVEAVLSKDNWSGIKDSKYLNLK